MPGTRPGITTERPCHWDLPRRRALGRLGEFLDHALAFEPRDVIDEQHAVEMIDLMLQAGGKEPARLHLLLSALKVEILDPHLRRPLDLLVELRDREAAFLVDRLLLRFPQDFRIDEDARLLLLVLLLGEIHGHDPARYADLNGGKSNAGRV